MLLGKNPAFAVGALLLPASTCRKGSPGCQILTLKCEFQTPCEFADNYSVQFPSFAPGCFCYKPPDLCTAFRGRALHWLSYEPAMGCIAQQHPMAFGSIPTPPRAAAACENEPEAICFLAKGGAVGMAHPVLDLQAASGMFTLRATERAAAFVLHQSQTPLRSSARRMGPSPNLHEAMSQISSQPRRRIVPWQRFSGGAS